MATVPVTREIGRAKVDRIQILRARGRTASQIAEDLDLDVYVVDEVFAWHDVLCGTDATDPVAAEGAPRHRIAARADARRTRIPA